MREVAEFVAAVVDYLKAESRAIKRSLARAAFAIGLLLVAAGLLLVAFLLFLYALFVALSRAMDPALAALFVGMVALALGGVVAWLARTNLK